MLILLRFSQNHLELFTSNDVNSILERISSFDNIWLRCIRFRDRTAIAKIINHFGLLPSRVDMVFNHFPLGIDEDIEDCLFDNYEIMTNQIKNREFEIVRGSIVVGSNFILTFETTEIRILTTLTNNIQKGIINLQNQNVDYLIYLIYRDILNNYYTVFDYISRQLDDLEDAVLDNSGDESTYQKIATMRQSTRCGRRNFQSIKSLLAMIDYEDFQWLSSPVKELFHQELAHQVDKLWQEYQALRIWMSELLEIQRDNTASKTSERINRLTILSTVFLPLTFITGFYGMNFKHMPELEHPLAYPMVICVMVCIVLGSIMYAKKQSWL
ncbi:MULTISPECIES: magnesium transporter CorA family protein [unclassified Tolypothrix]|uniref:magnesium transporter CorA family protein n=1 Tax=unclassified Tolypothrix TaxID=2649714 RepID=UPI0005EAB0FF|nr:MULTISPECIES: CorA family divalent cation transporter [unclassified Tolypothrix]BAY90368.1 Mg2+ transporter protein, CorA family protein [Microchaete diplosiphon NIES-3275]EKE98639.1 putative magnesium and cobalt transport protein CorA [Tolypothrix sp. PCC 7601]MBE9084278.1 magnesium transporter CorA [Tolypothrix sp. LEGE 11397]UYD24546.1 magnesium transporter CorA [Tolypothrix sp. PCC 7712]UYD33225.1 magnesium transporter CorA [Tolypothrix sp. PCC 7601]